MTNRTQLAQKVANLVQRLPVLDKTFETLLKTHGNRQEFERLAQEDSSLCAQLLFLANSQCYKAADAPAAETVSEALDRVDIDAVRLLTCATLVSENCQQTFLNDKMWAEYVSHSRAISRSAHILGELRGLSAPECQKLAVAGLTHDIGRVVLMISARPENASLLGTPPEKMTAIIQSEQQAYGLNHCVVGEHLFHRWGFPHILRNGILRHHTPLVDDDFSPPGAIIFMAHFVTMSDFTGAILCQMLGPELFERMDLQPRTLDTARHLYLTRPEGK